MATRKPRTTPANGTRDRILDAALALFNSAGVHAVTTRHVAAALGMSPGNLYYHFGNKEEIVLGLYGRIELELLATIAPPSEPVHAFDEVIAYLDRIFGHLWKFRFFYRDLTTLLADVPGLKERYRGLAERARASARGIFESMVDAGWLEASPEDMELLATNAWIVMTHWFTHWQVAARRRSIQSSDVNAGIRHLVALFSPRLRPAQRRQVQRFIDQLG